MIYDVLPENDIYMKMIIRNEAYCHSGLGNTYYRAILNWVCCTFT